MKPLGIFEGGSVMGSAGAVSYSAANQEYTFTGPVAESQATGEASHFVWKKLTGNFILRARIKFGGKKIVSNHNAGWMIRSDLAEDAPCLECSAQSEGQARLQFRPAAGAALQQMSLPVTGADVLQLERKGSAWIFSAAIYGQPFISCENRVELGDEIFAGIFAGFGAEKSEPVRFRDVRIVRPMKEDFTPYRDYIGSHLEILDAHTGRLELIYSSAQPFEAPNWTTDGRALIYNVSGRSEGWGGLRRFDLKNRKPSPIDTGFATQNNNDHVLSFDGTMLGISDQGEGHGGQSAIFTVPVKGGTPKRITPLTPSYLHGWSPAGKFLVYTGGRNNQFDIYKIPSDGSGGEIRLTHSSGLNDGPEYTPDGKYIYFNSSRSGRMQIWRMEPDGQNQEQVTDDEFNNWFPHISPDGKWIAFLSFPKEIAANDHPYYQRVYLRLMPIEGGVAKVIAYIYGGQGTINVPSWSPDSKKIAFVSNSDLS